MLTDLIALDQLLGGGLLVALLGWGFSVWNTARLAKALRLKELEGKMGHLEIVDAEYKESVKRVHFRMDVLENSQTKLEMRLDSDIQDVKRSIEKLSDLVIQALQRKGG